MEDTTAFSWGVLDGDPPDETADEHRPAAATPDLPPPEVTASLLRDGEVLWARFENGAARLGSGQRLLVVDGERASGWRRVEVVDAARLGVRLLPVVLADPPGHVGDDPAQLYRPAPLHPERRVDRADPFPVGHGPDVQAILAKRLKAVERAADERVARAERQARQQVEQAERRYRQQAAHAESAARAEVERISRETDGRVAAVSAELKQARTAQENARFLAVVVVVTAAILLIFVLARPA